MIRVSTELNRTCDGCSSRGPVTCYQFGTPLGSKTLRVCPKCAVKADRARVQLVTGGLDAVEVTS